MNEAWFLTESVIIRANKELPFVIISFQNDQIT